MITEVRSTGFISNQTTSNSKQTGSTVKTRNGKTVKTDALEISSAYTAAPVTSSDDSYEISSIESLKAQSDQLTENVRKLVQNLICQQGKNAKISLSNLSNFTGIDQDTISQAQQAISEDGDFGVKAVSDRISNFAIAISGGDTAKLEQLKAAIDKGFAKAEKAFGGKLPSICDDTYDAIMKKLDDWSQNQNAAAAADAAIN